MADFVHGNQASAGSFLKIFCCPVLIPHGKGSPSMAHTVTSAFRAASDIIIPDGQKHLFHRKTGQHLLIFPMSLDFENNHQVLFFTTVIQESIVTDFLETRRQYMHHKAADKFLTGYGDVLKASGFVILCRKSHFGICHFPDSAVCDGNAVYVTPQVFNGVAMPVKSFPDLGIPADTVEPVPELSPGITVFQLHTGCRKNKGFVLVILLEIVQEFPSEFFYKRFNSDEEVFRTQLQAFCFCQTAAGNNAVDMRMVV